MTFIIRKKIFKEMYVLSQDFEVSGGGEGKAISLPDKKVGVYHFGKTRFLVCPAVGELGHL